jgi:hypothetical protein
VSKSKGGQEHITNVTNYTSVNPISGQSYSDKYYGSTNTKSIVTQNNIAPHAAALYCDKLVIGGYSDWFLPNRYELTLLSQNKASITGIDISGLYWSSSEYSQYFAWAVQVTDSTLQNILKNNSIYEGGVFTPTNVKVRCMRKF